MEREEEGSVGIAAEEKADVNTQIDVPLLIDEKFDFDLSLSSSSANEDDEVFFGPVGHRERCVAAGLELQGLVPKEAEQPLTWSPLTGEKFVEIFKEARLLALQIQSSGKKPTQEPGPGPGEDFVQEARLKLDIFERGLQVQTSSPALKRETYCVLPPERLSQEPTSDTCLKSQAVVERRATSQLQPHKSSARPGKGAPTKVVVYLQTLRCNPFGEGGSLGSDPCLASLPRVDPSPWHLGWCKLPRPLGWGRRVHRRGMVLMCSTLLFQPQPGKQPHPTRLPTGSSGLSLGAVPSGPSSVASEASTASSSGLPAPGKFGARRTLLKPPGPTRTRLEGRNASSSGPVCTMNLTSKSSSLGTPASGKAPPSDPSKRLADTPRPTSSGQPGRQTLSCPKQTRATLAASIGSRAEEPTSAPPRQPLTPRPGLQRPNSNLSLARASQPPKPRGPACPSSSSKVGPPPPHPLKDPAYSAGISPDSVTPRVQGRSQLPLGPSLGSTAAPRGTPARYSSGGALQPPGSTTRTPLNVRRLSALPTPSGRRMSALPLWPTPRTGPRATTPLLPVAARHPAQVPPKKTTGRPGSSQPSDSPSVAPLALDFASPQQPAPGTPGEEAKEPPAARPAPAEAVLVHLGPKTTAPATATPPPRSQPLVDFTNRSEVDWRGPAPALAPALAPAPAPAPEGRLLIDLFDSPEGWQRAPAKPLPATGQLIDLSSPLISLSPPEDKENLPSPLLKL
ncbi:G2 and S phase-expressed protein 1 isoform X2 [Macrotis lagotis]|uniref:G2 and S phase-expressed protein 1 isoform X2 n=1 Tax=Macrotis lagotis TaxID=92651 RepID=UPI003D69DB2E